MSPLAARAPPLIAGVNPVNSCPCLFCWLRPWKVYPRNVNESGPFQGWRRLSSRQCRVARGNLAPGLPQNPGVTVSRHRALLVLTIRRR